MAKNNLATKTLITLSLVPALLSPATMALANENISIRNQCQNEAQEYGIETELIQQYVSDCIVALGGEDNSASSQNEAPSQIGEPENQGGENEQEQAPEQTGDTTQ